MTGLYNRKILKHTKNYGSIILCDIDYFKKINDGYGHVVGDRVLVEISRILKNNVDKNQIVCRWGGEEFIILLKNKDQYEAYELANNIKNKLSELQNIFGFNVTMSFGISLIKEDDMVDSIIKADIAMYQSKKEGRNKVSIYSLKY